LSQRLRHSEALAAAEALADSAPYNRDALYLVAANQRCLYRIPEALETLQRLEQRHPRFSLLYQERGYCYMSLRETRRAVDAFLQAVNFNPALAASWMMLERLYCMMGEVENAAAASKQVCALQHMPAEIVRASSLFSEGDLSAAASILRGYLLNANAIEAVRLRAKIALARLNRQQYSEALNAIETALKFDPRNSDYLSVYAAACVGLGRHDTAIAVYRTLLAGSPGSAELHVALGHSLKSTGRQQEAIQSYRVAATLRPSFGDAYWSLANLKTYCFSPSEIAEMRAQESEPAAHPVDRYHLCFALGKALEDRNDFAESWRFYERGNRLKRVECRYDSDFMEREVRKQIEICTAPFFAAREGVGFPHRGPIFIVGLPRSGSTLVEQILVSHSQVEATNELYDLQRIVLEIPGYPEVLGDLTRDDFRKLGERYLTDTSVYRTDKAFFVDKMPNNFRHIGVIQLMLPESKIIDVRREPMACCVSNLKQLFASGQEFSYSFDDIARYYRAYLELMRHWDAVLSGRILRVSYEELVKDLEGNVRRILDFCGLEFEPACIEFYKNERIVSTPSSEQVRRPIFRDALFQWRNFEPWLGPLKDRLGDALIRYL